MKLGVISDTHGDARLTRQALDALDAFQVDLILHCGDVGLEVMPLLAGRKVHFVAGNMDDLDDLLPWRSLTRHTLHDRLGTAQYRRLPRGLLARPRRETVVIVPILFSSPSHRLLVAPNGIKKGMTAKPSLCLRSCGRNRSASMTAP